MWRRLQRVCEQRGDTDDAVLQKTLLFAGSVLFALAALLWSALYWAFDRPGAAAIPGGYAAFSSASIAHFVVTRRYRFFRASQLILILLLPPLLMWRLGGFVNGSAVVIWAFLCPVAALLYDDPRQGPWWFAAFVAVVIGSAFAPPVADPPLPAPVLTMFFAMNLSGATGLVFLLVHFFVSQKNLYQRQSESLLLNILPEEIAVALKREKKTIAEHFDSASILFADLAGFTPLSASLAPRDLVELLNEIFSEFDALTEKHGLEKIKTIGDSYMVAAGVPRSRQDHAEILCRMALEMRACMESRTFRGHRIAFRIGINSGPVVAGVIGRKKFIYDLWGDAVNTASRMESHGKEGAIHVTGETHRLAKDRFAFEPRGLMSIKGKGEMETYFLVEERR